MKNLHKFLLVPALSPIFIVFIISLNNLDKKTELKLLTWKTPQTNLGLLMLISSSSAALLFSSIAIISNNKNLVLRRTVKISQKNSYQVNNPIHQEIKFSNFISS